MKHTTKMIIAAICAVMITAPAVFVAAPVMAQDIMPAPKNHGGAHCSYNTQPGSSVFRVELASPTGDCPTPSNLSFCGNFEVQYDDGRVVNERHFLTSDASGNITTREGCPSSGGGGSSGPSTGAIVGIGVAVGVGVFVMSEMADKYGLLPRGFTPDFRFAMNDAKRPAVYIGNVYPLSDNQTLRFGISEVLNDDGDDFTIAAEWRLSL